MSSEPLILASASPRRRELIAALGVTFEVRTPQSDERAGGADPARLAEGLALRKARDAAAREAAAGEPAAGRAIVGADTVVVLDGRVLSKPLDGEQARAMLDSLRGRTHEVITGVAVVAGERTAADHVRTAVTMRRYSDAEVERSIAGGSPLDKAGAYAIQDREFTPVERHEGCECSVIGLPLWTLRRLLRAAAGIEAAQPSYDRCAACPLRPSAAGP